MNTLVLFYFLHNVLATLILGSTFARKRDAVIKHFGIALLLNTIAFAIWSLAVMNRPANLESYVSAGVVFFLLSLLAFLSAGTQGLRNGTRKQLVIAGAVIAAVVFYLRMSAYPSAAAFSAEGLFFFNPHPFIALAYVFGLSLCAFPAIEALAAKFTGGYASLIRYGFIAEVAGGILLIVSSDSVLGSSDALYLAGWIMGLVYLALWTTFAFGKKAWQGIS